MQIDLARAAEQIRSHDRFLVLSHEHPDGDTLGSAFALLAILEKLGKQRTFLCADEVPKDFSYLTDAYKSDCDAPEYIVAVDVADERLLGSLAATYAGKVDLCIDHHMSNTFYAAESLVEDRAAACEIMLALCDSLGVTVDSYIGNCLYTGISTDTGCFRYQNTTAHTFRAAARLLEAGVDAQLINKLMFETKTRSFLRLELLARKTLEYHFDDRCAIITITQDMYKKSGSNEHECYPITALPRQIEGVKVGAVIKEKKNGSFGISVRTDCGIDASAICARLGGGGHKGAAGSDLSEDYETAKKRLLEAIRLSLDEEK